MKFFIAFACLLVVALANEDAKVLSNDAEVNVDSFKYNYEFDNHIKASQEGNLKDKDTWVVHGQYEYVAPEGEHIALTYSADETGYHPDPSSPLLPTPHPIPEYIQRAIAYIEAHPSKDAH